MAKKFLRTSKERKKAAPGIVTNAVIRGGSTVGACFLEPKIGAKLPEKLQKVRGPLSFAVGVIGEVFCKSEQAAAACQGLQTYGALLTAKKYDKKGRINLQGIGEYDEEIPEEDLEGFGEIDWTQMAKEAEEDVEDIPVSGLEDEELEGLEGDEDIPEEEDLEGLGETQPDMAEAMQ